MAQYARQMKYLECILSVTTGNQPAECNCIKLSGLDKPDNQGKHTGHVHNKVSTEEIYHKNYLISLQPGPEEDTRIKKELEPVKIPEGPVTKPWRPPGIFLSTVYFS